jgi:glycosyltransferase involved in cell wall biosynthesis
MLKVTTRVFSWSPIRLHTLAFALWRCFRLAGLLRSLGVGVVHVNGARCMLYAGPAARLAGIPCVWHVRVLQRDKVFDKVRSWFAHAIIANSHAVAASLEKTIGGKAHVHVVYNGFRLQRIRDAQPLDPSSAFGVDRRPVLVTAGRLRPWKRFEDLIEACAILRDRKSPCSCLIVGSALEGNTAYEARLKKQAGELELDNVRFTGWREDAIAIMKGADIFVLPSDGEPFGRVLIEAWAAGLAVVATDMGGPAEVVRNDKDGLLVPACSPPAADARVNSGSVRMPPLFTVSTRIFGVLTQSSNRDGAEGAMARKRSSRRCAPILWVQYRATALHARKALYTGGCP